MKRFILLSIIFVMVAGGSLHGQQVRDYVGVLDAKRTFEPTKISVEDTRYIGISYISEADSIVMQNCAIILRKDLDFSPYFQIVLLDTFFMHHMELTEMSILGWKRLGTKYLVKLDAEFPGDNMRLRYRLIDVDNSMETFRGKFEAGKADYRALTHTVANDIIKNLTGDPGIFRTKITYSRVVDDAREIYIADFDGYNERRITNNKSINLSPAFGPDGNNIYFTSYKDGWPKLYVYSLTNGTTEVISEQKGINSAAAVSPDGNSIACVLSKDGNSEIYLLDRSGKIKKRLTRSWAIETAPSWSPDGSSIAFTSDRTGAPQVYVMNSEGMNVRRLTFIGNYNDSPCWSPKGDRIAFVSRDNGFIVCSVDTLGNDFKILAHLGDNENPRYSPDGNHIIFTSNRLGKKDLYTMDLFGQNQRRLTSDGGYASPDWGPIRK